MKKKTINTHTTHYPWWALLILSLIALVLTTISCTHDEANSGSPSGTIPVQTISITTRAMLSVTDITASKVLTRS